LRNYKTKPQIWNGDSDCEHQWVQHKSGLEHENRNNLKGTQEEVAGKTGTAYIKKYDDKTAAFCINCSAWKGQLGLEPTFDLYIKHLCHIFDEIKRVLKKTGTCWVNLGDTYAGSWGNYAPNGIKSVQRARTQEGQRWSRPAYNDSKFRPPSSVLQSVQPKSLCQIPARFAIEMTNRGWMLRNELIWWKPNCMPSSAKDRFTIDFEKIFFFSKNKKYYFETQYEPWTDTRKADIQRAKDGHQGYSGKYHKGYNAEYRNLIGGQGIKGQPVGNPIRGRHKRCVWQITTQPFPEAHFAVYPEALIETPIKAGCPEFICKECGKPQEKIIKPTGNVIRHGGYGSKTATHVNASPTSSILTKTVKEKQIVGYKNCNCNKGFEPGIVLDPFMGSGTTALVALKLNRLFIGIEVNEKYITMARQRISRATRDDKRRREEGT